MALLKEYRSPPPLRLPADLAAPSPASPPAPPKAAACTWRSGAAAHSLATQWESRMRVLDKHILAAPGPRPAPAGFPAATL